MHGTWTPLIGLGISMLLAATAWAAPGPSQDLVVDGAMLRISHNRELAIQQNLFSRNTQKIANQLTITIFPSGRTDIQEVVFFEHQFRTDDGSRSEHKGEPVTVQISDGKAAHPGEFHRHSGHSTRSDGHKSDYDQGPMAFMIQLKFKDGSSSSPFGIKDLYAEGRLEIVHPDDLSPWK